MNKEAKKQELIGELDKQVNMNEAVRNTTFMQERNGDLHNLDIAQSTFIAEQRALQAKSMKEK